MKGVYVCTNSQESTFVLRDLEREGGREIERGESGH